ncbi:MAG: ribosome recycling factor [Micavibrio sp.]|nr:MAG: ribosome recycling factor [Micavibrio sp.]
MAELDMKDIDRRMQGAYDAMMKDMGGLRTGRASTALLESVTVEAYGSRMPLNQVGTVGAPEARLLTVQVWDAGLIKAVEKGITNAGLGLNPQSDGNLVRVSLPDLSEERRKELVKVAAQYAEQARTAVRNVRRDGMEAARDMEKDGDISEDEQKRLENEVQKLTDKWVAKIDTTLAEKEKDILQV